jgi:hypothetical protein
MNGDGRRGTGDIQSLSALLRHAFKRSCGGDMVTNGSSGGNRDPSIRTQDLSRVFAEFSVYLSQEELAHFIQGLRGGGGGGGIPLSVISASDVANLIWNSK